MRAFEWQAKRFEREFAGACSQKGDGDNPTHRLAYCPAVEIVPGKMSAWALKDARKPAIAIFESFEAGSANHEEIM